MSKDTKANADREHLHGPDILDKHGCRNAQGVFITITAAGNTEHLGVFNGNNGQDGLLERRSGARINSYNS